MDAIRKKVSLKLQVSVVNTQNNVNVEVKVKGVNNIDKNKSIDIFYKFTGFPDDIKYTILELSKNPNLLLTNKSLYENINILEFK